MKYTTWHLMIVVTLACIMAATLRSPSPGSVLVMLTCVCGLLGWMAISCMFSSGPARRMLCAASISGFGYLIFYIATNSLIEDWINNLSIVPFALMKGDQRIRNPQLVQLANSMEFQYFQQKMHLLFAFFVAVAAGWILPWLLESNKPEH